MQSKLHLLMNCVQDKVKAILMKLLNSIHYFSLIPFSIPNNVNEEIFEKKTRMKIGNFDQM